MLNYVEVLETLTNTMIQPKEGNTTHHTSEAYKKWLKKYRCACFTMLRSLDNDIVKEFENYPIAKRCGTNLKLHTMTTRLHSHAMTLKIEPIDRSQQYYA